MEAQRYPDDFDGIVAGAPACNWTEELGGRNAWINQVMYPDPNNLSVLDATDPDLDAFRERGGKLLMYNGWRDMALTPLGTIEYYEDVVERDASAADDVRLIMVPGMDHRIGGPRSIAPLPNRSYKSKARGIKTVSTHRQG